MLKKINRLTGKDINYILKKRKIVKSSNFSFMYFFQYQDKKYNQFSIQIPVKLNKHSNIRNLIKRSIYNFIKESGYIETKIGNNFYKVFIVLNKNNLEGLKNDIDSKNKKSIKDHILNIFKGNFLSFLEKLGKK